MQYTLLSYQATFRYEAHSPKLLTVDTYQPAREGRVSDAYVSLQYDMPLPFPCCIQYRPIEFYIILHYSESAITMTSHKRHMAPQSPRKSMFVQQIWANKYRKHQRSALSDSQYKGPVSSKRFHVMTSSCAVVISHWDVHSHPIWREVNIIIESRCGPASSSNLIKQLLGIDDVVPNKHIMSLHCSYNVEYVE